MICPLALAWRTTLDFPLTSDTLRLKPCNVELEKEEANMRSLTRWPTEIAAADKKDFLGKLHLQILARRAVWVASEEVRGGFRAAASPGCAGTSSHKWTHRPLPRHFNVSVKRTFSACRVKQQRDPSSAVQQAVIVGSLGSNVKNLFYKCVKSQIVARLLIQAND